VCPLPGTSQTCTVAGDPPWMNSAASVSSGTVPAVINSDAQLAEQERDGAREENAREENSDGPPPMGGPVRPPACERQNPRTGWWPFRDARAPAVAAS
jgi:hypothetical protein